MHQVVGALVRRIGAAVARRDVLQELDARARRARRPVMWSRAPCTLFRCSCSVPEVHALAGYPEAEHVAVERQARLGIARRRWRCGRCRGTVGRSAACHLGSPLSGRELQDLERMAVGIAEIEGPDARGVGDRLGEQLRPGGSVAHLEAAKPRVCAVHVAHDDGYVLEPVVVAPAVHRRRPARRREVLGELQVLVTQAQAHDAESHPEHAGQRLIRRSGHLVVAEALVKSSIRV